MTIAAALHARLRAALPEQVPVLLPEEIQHINAGGKPGQPAGLAAYLKAHPEGWVQVEEPQGLFGSLGGAGALWMVQVVCIAATAEEADPLARAALTVVSRAGTRTTPYELTTPHGLRTLVSGVVAASFILTAREGI